MYIYVHVFIYGCAVLVGVAHNPWRTVARCNTPKLPRVSSCRSKPESRSRQPDTDVCKGGNPEVLQDSASPLNKVDLEGLMGVSKILYPCIGAYTTL